MISLYCLAYRVPEFFKQSIDSIIANLSEEVEITVAENYHHKCIDEIADYAKQLVDDGKIKRFIKFHNNSMIRAFNYMYENYPPAGEFFMMTELDLVVPDCDIINLTKKAQENANLTGFRLSLENYKSPNRGHLDLKDNFGIWLMGLNSKIFREQYSKLRGRPLSDDWIRQAYHGKGIKSIEDHKLYHLAWDLPFKMELRDYWNQKARKIDWQTAPIPKVNYIYEKK